MYIFNSEEKFVGTYLQSTEQYNAHYDMTKQINIETLINKTSNCKYGKEIEKYFRDDDVVYRLKKKYVSIDFEKIYADAQKGIDVTKALDNDFELLNSYVIEQIKKEPLILSFPFKGYTTSDYFIKTDHKVKTNKKAFVNQFTIGTERLHRISATIQDDYIILFTENLIKCNQLYELLDYGYVVNYDLIYNNIESLNPYGFEDMAKEMFDKLHSEKICENLDYLPKNKYIKFKGNNKILLSDGEVDSLIGKITTKIQAKVANTANNKVCPIYSDSLAKLACERLVKEFSNSAIRESLKSGELVFDEKAIYKDLQGEAEFNPNLVNFLIDFKLCFKDITSYLAQTNLQFLEAKTKKLQAPNNVKE